MFFVAQHNDGYAVLQPSGEQARPVKVSDHRFERQAQAEADALNERLCGPQDTTPADMAILLEALN